MINRICGDRAVSCWIFSLYPGVPGRSVCLIYYRREITSREFAYLYAPADSRSPTVSVADKIECGIWSWHMPRETAQQRRCTQFITRTLCRCMRDSRTCRWWAFVDAREYRTASSNSNSSPIQLFLPCHSVDPSDKSISDNFLLHYFPGKQKKCKKFIPSEDFWAL